MLDPTLFGLLSQIEHDDIVLPAMQRPFVWKEDRVYRLIDSLLRGFPIGAIMLWKTTTIQRFRRLPRDVDADGPEIFNFEVSSQPGNKYLVLDGQQRLTSLFAAFKGSYGQKALYIDVLSGSSEGKDPGNEYYDCQFLSISDASKLTGEVSGTRRHFVPIRDLVKINPVHAAATAHKKAVEMQLNESEAERIADIYIRCATILGNNKSLQVITVDEDPSHTTPVEEVLEIFVRINSGGLVLQKSDLLMSLLDLTWNDIQPELQTLVRDINEGRPFSFTRDDVLKTLLLADGAETRFNRLVSDRKQVERLADRLPTYIPATERAWQLLGIILLDDCEIHSERFFRGGHNALLPFVLFLSQHEQLSKTDRKRIVIGIYVSIMSGVFSSAEARMGAFTKNLVANAATFPLRELVDLVKREYGIKSLDEILLRHLDLALNIAHGGITLDKNPEQLQRDHIFPKSQLEKAGYPYEVINHYANFHFLRATDNLNKLDRPPHEWFRSPGKNAPRYTEDQLAERLLTWDDLEPGHFESMLQERGAKIRQRAEQLFGLTEEEFNGLFVDEIDSSEIADPEEHEGKPGQIRTDPELLNAKRQQAVDAFGVLKGIDLTRRSQTLFWSADKDLRVCCAVSKRYERDSAPYWYGYDRKWDEFLAGGRDSYFLLSCMDSNIAFAIPFSWMTENKKHLNMTERVDKLYWHIALTPFKDGFALNLSRKGTKIPLNPWAFPLYEAVKG
jgi:hypothetical protein